MARYRKIKPPAQGKRAKSNGPFDYLIVLNAAGNFRLLDMNKGSDWPPPVGTVEELKALRPNAVWKQYLPPHWEGKEK